MPGIDIQLSNSKAGQLHLRANSGPSTAFQLTSIPTLSRESASLLIQNQSAPDASKPQLHAPLLLTRSLSEATRGILREHHISWAERNTGFLHLAAPGILVDLQTDDGESKTKWARQRAKLQGISGLVAETLAAWPAGEFVRLRDLAETAAVSSALASRVLQRLHTLRIVEALGSGPRRHWTLLEKGGLLDLWAEEEHRIPSAVAQLNVWSRSPNALLAKLPDLNRLTNLWALAGTAAANLYAPTLTSFPEPAIWIDAKVPVQDVARTLGGEKVESGGNIHIWQSERNLPLRQLHSLASEGVPGIERRLQLVSRPRAYVEALLGAGRSPEVAQNLRERILRNDS